MNYTLGKTMHEAMRLMQTGDLHAATAAIQRGLRGAEGRSNLHPEYARQETGEPAIDAECQVLDISCSEPITNTPNHEPAGELRKQTLRFQGNAAIAARARLPARPRRHDRP
jgi:hypothetical protein